MKKRIDLILPCYNPDEGWERQVVSKYKDLQKVWEELDFHLYIVNDGSVSGFGKTTVDYLASKISDVHIISYSKNRGKGFALREAVKLCHSDYMVYTDYDFPYTESSMSCVIKALLDGFDVVVAERGNDYSASLPLSRRLISVFFRFCNRCLLRMEYPDTQAGLKGFNRRGRKVFLATWIETYLFDWEFIYKSCKEAALNVTAVPIKLRENVCFSPIGIVSCLMELKFFLKKMQI